MEIIVKGGKKSSEISSLSFRKNIEKNIMGGVDLVTKIVVVY